ncbi:hypothetical protein MMC30_003972 [Trapelia coarctata]|nr:hypothetical protein [Trapelia coarctata]
MGVEVCSDDHNSTLAQCSSRRGGLFDIAAAGSSFVGISLMDLAADAGWQEIMKPLPPFTVAGNTTLQLPADISVPMSIAVITQGQNHTAGHIGLGIDSVFLHALVSQGLASAPAFGMNAGSQSHSNPRDGSLVLGGYDKASVNGHFTNYSMDYPVIQRTESRICPLQVIIEKLVLRPASGVDVELISGSQPTPACIELYDNLFRLPPTVLQLFKENTGWKDATTVDSDLLVAEPGLLYPRSVGFNGSLIFLLNNGLEVEIPNEELQHPVRGINENGTRILQDNITEVNIYSQPAPLDMSVLGKVFLSQVYLAVDYQEMQFKLSRFAAHAVTPDPTAPESSTISCFSPTMEPSTIALIVIAAVFGLFLSGLLLYCVTRRSRGSPSAHAPFAELSKAPPHADERNHYSTSSGVPAIGQVDNELENPGRDPIISRVNSELPDQPGNNTGISRVNSDSLDQPGEIGGPSTPELMSSRTDLIEIAEARNPSTLR